MSAHVLLNSLNKLGKKDIMRGLHQPYNNTGARMLDSFYHRVLKLRKS